VVKKNRIGERNQANNGQMMTIIAYRNNKDLDVEFEDGTIVTNKDYACFREGRIKNPNLVKQVVGKKSMSNQGQEMECIAFRSYMDIDVRFEDGTIVKNRQYTHFIEGGIKNPNFCKTHIGERRKNKSDLWMTIIYIENMSNITVQFDDGEIITNKKYSEFVAGNIGHPFLSSRGISHKDRTNNTCVDLLADQRIGMKSMSKRGQKMTIIAYRSASDIDVQFEDGTIVEHTTFDKFKARKIKNPMYFKNKYIGKKNVSNEGYPMTIIDYISWDKVLVRFDNGYETYTTASAFDAGQVRNPQVTLDNRIGQQSTATNGQIMTIIGYRNSNDIDVQFEDGTIVEHKSMYAFYRGVINNPNKVTKRKTSVNEFAILFYLERYGFKKMPCGSMQNLGFGKKELDCYNEDKLIAIEYDGGAWHTNPIRDIDKNQICANNKIFLYRIRCACELLDYDSPYYRQYFLKPKHELSKEFENVLKDIISDINQRFMMKIDVNDIDFNRDRNAILDEFHKRYQAVKELKMRRRIA
jgi:hypothetical protein